MTGRAVEFWRNHAQGRQTIVYAVSVTHAENLTAVFNESGISAGVIHGGIPAGQRAWVIRQFSEGELRVLVNVVVATEGFDLPDAACVVLARPTMSLALYLQMVGRGLRPKPNSCDYTILDLAGNVQIHGFPDDERQWSLQPRGHQETGYDPPVVRCPDCSGVSPAASHSCRLCDNSFGKTCRRCGSWRAWKRWSAEELCGDKHDLVCNHCHSDAHMMENLPVERRLREVLEEELTDRLRDLEGVRTQIREIAKQLSLTYSKTDFSDLTDQLGDLLRVEEQTKKDIHAQMERKIGKNMLKHVMGYLQVSVEEIAEDEFQEGQGRCRLIRRRTGEIIEWLSSH